MGGRGVRGLKIHLATYQAGLTVAAQKWTRRLDLSVSPYYECPFSILVLFSAKVTVDEKHCHRKVRKQ